MAVVKSSALKAFTVAALALPGMIQTTKASQSYKKPAIDFQYGRYQESNDRISVDIFQGKVLVPISKALEIKSNWVVDTFSGATPVLTMPDSVAQVITGASGIVGVDGSKAVLAGEKAIEVMTGASTRETRYGVDLGFSYILDDLTFHASGSRSEEPDYLSHGYHLGIDWEFNNKFNTLSLGIGQNFDQIEPNTRALNKEKTDYHFQIGFSQVVSKKSLLKLSANYTYNEGYLSNPYKKVFIQGLPLDSDLKDGGFTNIFYENRPGKRHQGSISLGYIQYFSTMDSALHMDYRYFMDDWGISSHTIEFVYHQPVGKGWILKPRIRYYSQSDADFYQFFYAAPRSDNYYSSDFRLARFGSLGGGLKLSKEWQSASIFTESIKLEVGFEYTSHAASLELSGQTASDLNDFSYMLFTGAIKITF